MWDKLRMAYRSIRERKARSILTVLGMVGIAAIVSLMSVGYGMEEAITGELVKIDENKDEGKRIAT